MKISVILAHPKKGSFNHALADAACRKLKENGHEVIMHDLYAENFDSVFTAAELDDAMPLIPGVASHCSEAAQADGFVIIHPNWWGQPPAILKGWVDRVFRAGVAYSFKEGDSGEGVPVGLLKAGAAVVLNTSDTPAGRELAAFGDPLESIWRKCIFGLCGVKNFHRKMFRVVVTSTAEERKKWLEEAKIMVGECFPARAPEAQHTGGNNG